jgi:hypothetical protein
VLSVSDLRFQTAQLTGTAADRGGDRSVLVLSSDRPAETALLDGRPATDPGDIVLAPATAELLGARVGSAVPVRGQLPGACTRPDALFCPPDEAVPGAERRATLTVSGIGFVQQTEYNEYDSGAWVSPRTYADLFGTGFLNHELLLRLEPGSEPTAVAARMVGALGNPEGVFTAEPPLPRRAAEVGDLRVLPVVLGAFLAGLALAATGHVLVVAMRRRRAEVAVLRALGLTPAQVRWTAATQAAVYAVAGLAFGIPLGIAAGRVLWWLVSDQTPLVYRPPLPALVLLLAVPITLLTVQVLALPVARLGCRARVAEVLRAE